MLLKGAGCRSVRGFLATSLVASGLLGCVDIDSADDSESSVESAVVLGTQESELNFPWVVKVQGASGVCHGTLISAGSATAPAWVLTAAHCVEGAPITVSYYRLDPATNQVITRNRMVSQIFAHEQYDGAANNDIAVVSFPPFDADPSLTPARLPFAMPFNGQAGEFADYQDHTSTLPPGKVAVYRGFITNYAELKNFTVHSIASSICGGDSGSGFVMRGGGVNFVYGVISHSSPFGGCVTPNEYGVAQNVYLYKDWILLKTGIASNELGTLGAKSDVLWRRDDPVGQNDGALAVWKVSEYSHTDKYPSYYGNNLPVTLDWKIAGTGDIDGDGQADIVWRKDDTKAVAVWKIVDGLMVWDSYPTDGGTVPNSNWNIVEIADVDGDGRKDIVWRNVYSGSVKAWKMGSNGMRISTTSAVNMATSYTVVGAGRTQNGSWENVLFRNTSGDVYSLNVGTGSLNYIGSAGTDWKIEGVGDLTGDGRADIVWRQDTTTNMVVWRLLSPNSYISEPVNWGYVGPDWKVQGIGDFNGDGAGDILWRNTGGNKPVVVWSMFGGLNYQQWTLSYGQGAEEWTIQSVSNMAN